MSFSIQSSNQNVGQIGEIIIRIRCVSVWGGSWEGGRKRVSASDTTTVSAPSREALSGLRSVAQRSKPPGNYLIQSTFHSQDRAC